jgi:hypothetical protein
MKNSTKSRKTTVTGSFTGKKPCGNAAAANAATAARQCNLARTLVRLVMRCRGAGGAVRYGGLVHEGMEEKEETEEANETEEITMNYF